MNNNEPPSVHSMSEVLATAPHIGQLNCLGQMEAEWGGVNPLIIITLCEMLI